MAANIGVGGRVPTWLLTFLRPGLACASSFNLYMKLTPFPLLAVFFGFLIAGCDHLDTTPPAPADRILSGVVTNNAQTELPADSEVTVRVLDVSRGESRSEVLGEQTIKNPGRMPVAFRIEYRAEDAILARGVTVDARISVGGRLRYTTASAHPVTLGNVHDSHVVEVALATKH